MASAALARVQAEQNQEMADAQNEDSYVKKMEYNRAEAVLVQSAQTKMNAYWQKAKNSPALEEALITANTEYEAMAVKASGGMIAQAELLAAKEKRNLPRRQWKRIRRRWTRCAGSCVL